MFRLLTLATVSTTAAMASSVYVMCPPTVSSVEIIEVDMASGTNTSLITFPLDTTSGIFKTAVDVSTQTMYLALDGGAGQVIEVSVQNKTATPTTWSSPFAAIAFNQGMFYGRTPLSRSSPAKFYAGSLTGGFAESHLVSTLAPNTMYAPGGSYDATGDNFYYMSQPDFHKVYQTNMKTGKTTTLTVSSDSYMETIAFDAVNSRLISMGSSAASHDCTFYEIDSTSGATTALFTTEGVTCAYLLGAKYEPVKANWYIILGSFVYEVGMNEKKVLAKYPVPCAMARGMAVL